MEEAIGFRASFSVENTVLGQDEMLTIESASQRIRRALVEGGLIVSLGFDPDLNGPHFVVSYIEDY